MLTTEKEMATFSLLHPIDGYLPLEEHGLVGDVATPWRGRGLCVGNFVAWGLPR